MPNCSCMQKCMDVFYNDVLHVYATCVCVCMGGGGGGGGTNFK